MQQSAQAVDAPLQQSSTTCGFLQVSDLSTPLSGTLAPSPATLAPLFTTANQPTPVAMQQSAIHSGVLQLTVLSQNLSELGSINLVYQVQMFFHL